VDDGHGLEHGGLGVHLLETPGVEAKIPESLALEQEGDGDERVLDDQGFQPGHELDGVHKLVPQRRIPEKRANVQRSEIAEARILQHLRRDARVETAVRVGQGVFLSDLATLVTPGCPRHHMRLLHLSRYSLLLLLGHRRAHRWLHGLLPTRLLRLGSLALQKKKRKKRFPMKKKEAKNEKKN